MTAFSNFPAQTQKLRADSKVSSTRVASNALGALLTSRSAANLSPLASGCLVALVKFAVGRDMLESLGSTTTLKDAQTILSMKGLSVADSELAMSVLVMSGLVQVDSDALRIPLLDHSLRKEAATLANRVAGWRKREAAITPPALVVSQPEHGTGPQSIADAPVAAPAPAPTQASVPAPAPAAASVASVAPAAVPVAPTAKAPAPAVKRSATNAGRRFSVSDKEPTDPSVDPVLVRVLCENGQFAELTAQYVEHLQDNFKTVDALVQLRRAALWCESNPKKLKTFNGMRKFLTTWLGSAAREADVRNAVVRVGNQKNGFGQGGDYASAPAAATTQPAVQGSLPLADDATDDFLDLAPADLDVAPVAAPPAARIVITAPVLAPSQHAAALIADRPVQSSAVLAARANASAARAASAVRAGQTRQSPTRGNFLSQPQR